MEYCCGRAWVNFALSRRLNGAELNCALHKPTNSSHIFSMPFAAPMDPSLYRNQVFQLLRCLPWARMASAINFLRVFLILHYITSCIGCILLRFLSHASFHCPTSDRCHPKGS